jgi:hypothetical protein
MNGRMLRNLLLILVFTVISASLVLAAPTGGTVSTGPSERGTGSSSGTTTAQGGNVTQINVSGTAITGRWAGFYGSISGNITLSDAANNNFYAWTITNFTNAVVYAANGTISTWNLVPINNSIAPIGIQTAAADNFNNTFGSTGTFSSASMSVASTPLTNTYQGGSVGTLKTYALVTSDGLVNVWAGVAQWNTTSFKTGQRVDYQIIAPAKTTGTTYNFYLELP